MPSNPHGCRVVLSLLSACCFGLKPIGQLETDFARITVNGVITVIIPHAVIFLIKNILAVKIDVKIVSLIPDFSIHDLEGIPGILVGFVQKHLAVADQIGPGVESSLMPVLGPDVKGILRGIRIFVARVIPECVSELIKFNRCIRSRP